MKTKDEIFNKFKVFKFETENQTEKKIKILRSNRGEYSSDDFVIFYHDHGIIYEIITPFSSQSNGIVEQKDNTIRHGNIMFISLVF